MLEYELTTKNAGIILWGDTWALRAVHSLLHKINDENSNIENKEGFLLGLAYDVRKAYEGSHKKSIRERFEDKCPIYGVEVLWPMIVAQVGVLRASMAFVPTDRFDQAVMFELEHIVEQAAKQALPRSYEDVLYQMARIGSERPSYVEDIIWGRCHYFVSLAPKDRLKQLRMLLASFDRDYHLRSDILERNGAKGVIPVSALAEHEGNLDWPDFEW